MLYTPADIAVQDLGTIAAPYLGGEWKTYLSGVKAVRVGEISLSAAATGTLSLATGISLSAGYHLQVVAETAVESSADVVITLVCKDNSGTPATMNGVATLTPPAYSVDTSKNFQRGWSADLVPATEGKKFTEITSLSSVAGGGANQVFGIYYLPDTSDWFEAGCLTGFEFNTRERQPLSIDCQMEASKFTKLGKTKKGEFSARWKFQGFGSAAARFLGHRGTLRLDGIKDGLVTGDRAILTNCVIGSRHNAPDGDGEHIMEITGEYTEVLFFVPAQAS